MASIFGAHAVDLIAQGRFDRMVAWSGRTVIDVPLADAIAGYAAVDQKGRWHSLRAGWASVWTTSRADTLNPPLVLTARVWQGYAMGQAVGNLTRGDSPPRRRGGAG